MHESELRRYHENLLALRRRVEEDFEGLRLSLGREGTEIGNVDVPSHNADHDTEGLGPELAMETTEASIAAAIEAALERIEAGTFGRCEDCGQPIPKRRLDAAPYAAVCIACARVRETG
jgi:RNA polymerase-binding transcription factor DksA